MSETVNQETTITQATEAPAMETKTFTQAEVNKLVAERLQREKAKYTDYESLKEKADKLDALEESSKSELQKATEKAERLEKELKSIKEEQSVKSIRDKVSEETGVPASLLTEKTEEACKAQAESILAFAKPSGYPVLKDSGEPQSITKNSARDDFKNWANQVNS